MVFWVVFGLLAIVLLLLAATWAIGWQVDIVRSGSMAPTVPRGSVAVIAPISPRAVQPGDVIRFRSRAPGDDRLVLHRVVRTEAAPGGLTAFWTQGDANATPDPRPVYDQQLQGRMVFHVPRLGAVFYALRSPVGLALLVGAPLAISIASEVLGRRGTPAAHS
jgi:signal peptidase